MKLILCPHCTDVRKLLMDRTLCQCGRSWGRYLDNEWAEVGGDAKVIGLSNLPLRSWLISGAEAGKQLDCYVYDEDGPRSHVTRGEGIQVNEEPKPVSFDHDQLIEGLGLMVMNGEMPATEAMGILQDHLLQHPGQAHLDGAILWQVRKDLGLRPEGQS